MNDELSSYYLEGVPAEYNQNIQQILAMIMFSFIQYAANIHYLMVDEFTNEYNKYITYSLLGVPGFFYTVACFLSSRSNIFTYRDDKQRLVGDPGKAIAKNQSSDLYRRNPSQISGSSPQRATSKIHPEPTTTGPSQPAESGTNCCAQMMNFLFQALVFAITLIANQFILLLKYPSVFVYIPNGKPGQGRSFQRKFGVNTMYFIKGITYDVPMIALVVHNSKLINCAGIVALFLALFELFYYFTPYLVHYQACRSSLADVLLLDHPKIFPQQDLIVMQQKYLKYQKVNQNLQRRYLEQEKIREMAEIYEQEKQKTAQLMKDQEKQILELTYQNVYIKKRTVIDNTDGEDKLSYLNQVQQTPQQLYQLQLLSDYMGHSIGREQRTSQGDESGEEQEAHPEQQQAYADQ